MIIQYAAVTNTGWLCGQYEAVPSQRFDLAPNNAATRCIYGNGTSGDRNVVAPPLLAGNLCIAGKQPYRNGVVDGGAIGGGAGVYTLQINIGNASTLSSITATIIALAVYSVILTAPQVLARATAMSLL
jgi:hypothetical protein